MIKAISETLIEHSHQSNHETNLTISLSDFYSLPHRARVDEPPDELARWINDEGNTIFSWRRNEQTYILCKNNNNNNYNNKSKNNNENEIYKR